MAKMKRGRIAALCINDKKEVRKYPQEYVVLTEHGFAGDRHEGPTRRSYRTGEQTFNDRQITIVAKEVVDEIARELQIEIPAGGLGENILVEGLGDLSDLKGGELFEFEGGVVLEVTGQNSPCKNINVYHKLVVKKIYGRRGVIATVRMSGIIYSDEYVVLTSGG